MSHIFQWTFWIKRKSIPYPTPKYIGSLGVFGPIVWNDLLPEKIKKCTTSSEFKDAIKFCIPTNCPCRLCKEYISGVGFI